VPERIVLKVAEAPQSDVRLGPGRVDTEDRVALGVDVGEIIQILGQEIHRGEALPRDAGRRRKESSASMARTPATWRELGDKVEVRKARSPGGAHHDRADHQRGPQDLVRPGIENFVKRGLLKRPLNKGDSSSSPNRAHGRCVAVHGDQHAPKGVVQIPGTTRSSR